MKELYLIDGHSQLFKAFFAIRNLSNSRGFPTNMIFGFAQMLNRILKEYQPRHIAVVFDAPGPSFRAEIAADYKANRPPPPEDFNVQIPHIKKMLEAFGIPMLEKEGFEADDIIATLSRRAGEKGYTVRIITNDKDLFQLINDNVTAISMRGDQVEHVDSEKVKDKMGVRPDQMLDLQGLIGDSVDNIPGVPGVGPKTGAKLLQQFETLDNLYEHLEEINSPKQREKLEQNKDSALLSRRLAELDCNVELEFEPDDLERGEEDKQILAELFDELEFRNFQQRYPLSREQKQQIEDAATNETESVDVEYETVTEKDSLRKWRQEFADAELLAFDTETDGTDPNVCRLVGISLSAQPGQAIYIPVGHSTLDPPQLEIDEVCELLGPLLAKETPRKAAQNYKYDLRVLERHGFQVRGIGFDTMLASYILDPDGSHALKKMAREHLNIRMTEIVELIGSGKSQMLMSDVPVEDASRYACADADITLRLTHHLKSKIDGSPMKDLYYDVELPLVEVLNRMETIGVNIDVEYFKNLSKRFEKELESLAQQIYEHSGRSFRINSPKQVGEVLFEDLKLPVDKVKRGKSGALSTDVTVLEMLAPLHPLPKLLLEYRQFEKLKGTYVDPLPALRDKKSGRIHTSFNQTIAATGRLSSSHPNLQNIPVRTEEGRAIRKGFIPSSPEHVLLAADYSQIELRVLAHVTKDQSLVRAFNAGEDIHRLTASKVFGLPPEEVSSEMRSQAKVINFGIIYGMSAHRLAGQLEIPRGRAQDFINEYFNAYPRVKAWTEQIVREARERGYVETMLKRRRYVHGLKSRNFNTRSAAERIAVNTPIQGTAADMIKKAMVEMDRELQKCNGRTRMILQVHDELIFDLPESEVKDMQPLIEKTMAEALPLSVPIVVDVKIGRDWAEC